MIYEKRKVRSQRWRIQLRPRLPIQKKRHVSQLSSADAFVVHRFYQGGPPDASSKLPVDTHPCSFSTPQTPGKVNGFLKNRGEEEGQTADVNKKRFELFFFFAVCKKIGTPIVTCRFFFQPNINDQEVARIMQLDNGWVSKSSRKHVLLCWTCFFQSDEGVRKPAVVQGGTL